MLPWEKQFCGKIPRDRTTSSRPHPGSGVKPDMDVISTGPFPGSDCRILGQIANHADDQQSLFLEILCDDHWRDRPHPLRRLQPNVRLVMRPFPRHRSCFSEEKFVL